MDKEQVAAALKMRLANPQRYNLVYVVLPNSYSFLSVAEELATELDAEYISVIGLLAERLGKVWDRIIEREIENEVSTIAGVLREMIRKNVQNFNKPVVLADVEVLSIMPEIDLTSLLYQPSNSKLICVFLRGEFTGQSIRLLRALPEFDVQQCTVLNLTEL